MSLAIVRISFVLASTLVGYSIGSSSFEGLALVGAGLGLAGSLLITLLELKLQRASVRGLSAAMFGLIFGLIMARLIMPFFDLIPMAELNRRSLNLILLLVFCYIGVVMAVRGRDEFGLIIPYVKFTRQDQREEIALLDTSAIIDGRIADISQAKFIEGRFVIPRFVLTELQRIADSPDTLKRNRGRRGLDILNKLRKDANIDVKIHEGEFPEVPEVDGKLVKLAKLLNAKIMTTDFNLNKIAELQGVKVLNVNELAGALRPVVLPGEQMEVRPVKEGKEHDQGVAYLDDGTMVVVEEGRRFIGQKIRVVVTSVLQTQAGRMIFTKLE